MPTFSDGAYDEHLTQGWLRSAVEQADTLTDTLRNAIERRLTGFAFIDVSYPPPVPATAPALPEGVLQKGKQQIGLFVPECMR